MSAQDIFVYVLITVVVVAFIAVNVVMKKNMKDDTNKK